MFGEQVRPPINYCTHHHCCVTSYTLLLYHHHYHTIPLLLVVIFDAMDDAKKWQIKEGSLRLLAALAKTAPAQVSACLPAIVPLISERMVDAREQV